ncbi:MAG TPA: VOC family protein [Acidimicrobiales bacterium]|nr:VOC family protein [Acidimicrobiales bacterium]
MTSWLRNITFDCRDALALGRFWAAVLGWNVYCDDDPPVLVAPSFPPPAGPTMLFIPVPEPRTVKNRVHVDLAPADRARDEEVARLVELGATVVEDHRDEPGEGLGWVWLADPEGNDFCVELSTAERAHASAPKVFRLTGSG